MSEVKGMNQGESLVYDWIADNCSSTRGIHRVPEKSPDFIVDMNDGKKVYVEATECGWRDSLGQDTREVERKLEKIIEDEIKDLKSTGEMPEDCRIALIVDWPYTFIPTKKSVREADSLEMSSKDIKRKIREVFIEYAEEVSHGEDALNRLAYKEKSLSLISSCVPAKFRIHKSETDGVRVSYAEKGMGYLVAKHISSVIGEALNRKTNKKVREKEGYFEYWLAVVDRSYMLVGDDHKPEVEEWRRDHWISSKEEIDKNPNSKYWDRIVVVSDYNGSLDYFDVINRGAY